MREVRHLDSVALSLYSPALPSSALALSSTVHLALAALRHHRRPARGPFNALAIVAGVLSLLPWIFPSATGILAGLAVHGLWYGACEFLVQRVQRSSAPTPASGIRPPASPPARLPPDGPKRPSGFVQTPVLAVFAETADIRTFRLARPAGFEFVAGQFLPVRIRCDGRELVRCYSISSAPSVGGYLEISVKRQGVVSSALHAVAAPGTSLGVRAPAGAFTYPASDDRPLLLLAGGIGITPLLSMLRYGVAEQPGRPITLLYSAPTVESLAFRDDIQEICRRHPHASAFFAVTRGGGGPALYSGRIDEALLRASMADVRDAIAMICGPQPMIDSMRTLLGSMGVPPDQIRSELFEAAVASSTGHHPERPMAGAMAEGHEVRCVRSGTTIRSAAGQTLLDAAEVGGVAIDSLCRSGLCGTCRTRVVGGEVACESTVLAADDRALGYVLACVAHARTDCAIEA